MQDLFGAAVVCCNVLPAKMNSARVLKEGYLYSRIEQSTSIETASLLSLLLSFYSTVITP